MTKEIKILKKIKSAEIGYISHSSGVRFSHSDIYLVVDNFYKKVSKHPSLKIPFQSVNDWQDHIERMTQFWWIRFGGKPYMFSQYNPVLKHYYAGFNQKYLTEWLDLFHDVIRSQLTTEQFKAWEGMSVQMGRGLLMSNKMVRVQKNGSQK